MTMSRPRVLTESDAGTMDTLLKRTDTAATQAEARVKELGTAIAAVPSQVSAATAPAVAAAQQAAALAVQRSGVLGSVASEADLAGKQAGDWRIGQQLVTWSGSTVTARTAVLEAAGAADVAAVQPPTTIADEAALGGKAAGQYLLSSTGERVAWSGTAITARGPMSASTLQVAAVTERLNRAPLAAPAQTRGVILRGGVPHAPAPAGLIPDGKTIIEEPDGLYHRVIDAVLPWEGGALPGTATTRRNSGAALQTWIDQLGTRGTNLTLPPGFWYTDRMLTIIQDDLMLDWRGALRPVAGYTGFLIKVGSATRTAADLWGSYEDGGQWQNPVQIRRLVLDGMFESQGAWLEHLDHFDISIFAGRTRRAGLLLSLMREGKIRYTAKHWLSYFTPDDLDNPLVANLQIIDQDSGDANNSFDIEIRSVYGRGRAVAIDAAAGYPSAANPNPPRLLRLTGQIELPGEDFAYGRKTDGTPNVLAPYTGDKVFVGQSDAISFKGQFTPGALVKDKAMFVLGAPGKLSTECSVAGSVYGVSAPSDSYFVIAANAVGWEVDLRRNQLANMAQIVKTPTLTASQSRVDAAGPQVIVAEDYGLRLASNGADRSASVEFQAPDGSLSRIWGYEKQLALQAVKGGANLAVLTETNALLGLGARGIQLGNSDVKAEAATFKAHSSVPVSVTVGWMGWCDGVGWNPLNRSGGAAYPVVYTVDGWRGLTLSTS